MAAAKAKVMRSLLHRSRKFRCVHTP
jgi:hypothetical protein